MLVQERFLCKENRCRLVVGIESILFHELDDRFREMKMKINSLFVYPTQGSLSARVDGSRCPENPLVKSLKSISNGNIEIANSSRNETIFDYLYQARKYYVENKQNDNIHLYDRMFMQELISGEQKRKPGLHITLSNSPGQFASEIVQLKTNQPDIYHGQFIVNMGKEIHYAALDVFIKDGNVSIIGIEPSNLDCMGPAKLLFGLLNEIKEKCSNTRIVMMESNIQQSPADCAIFSLHFALKMHGSKDVFDVLHKELMYGSSNSEINISDEDSGVGYISRERVDQYLPVEFMKHANSKARLTKYFTQNAKVAHIAQEEESTIARQGRYTFERGARTYSASIEDKRIKFIERTIKANSSEVKKLKIPNNVI